MRPDTSPTPEHRHLTREAVEAFLYRTEEPEERLVLYHLLTCCAPCREAAYPLLEMFRAGIVDGFTSPLEIDLAASEWNAPRLWDGWRRELLAGAETVEETLERLDAAAEWPTWGLAAWLSARSEEASRDDPQAALEWAQLAVAAASGLREDEPAPEEWNVELRAYAQAVLGNAHRVRGGLDTAERAFDTAGEMLAAYEEDPPDFLPFRARAYRLGAALMRDRGRFAEALELLDAAAEAWEVVHPPRPEERARVLLEKARVRQELDDPEGALLEHHRFLELLEPTLLGNTTRRWVQ